MTIHTLIQQRHFVLVVTNFSNFVALHVRLNRLSGSLRHAKMRLR
ncbi:hypothetical protein [Scytonema sp. HK-05]|nr:hypothetical protein [Scytonema sp. HK-05]